MCCNRRRCSLPAMFVCFAVVALCCLGGREITCATAPVTDLVGEDELGFDYKKLVVKLEILDAKLTRIEATSREQFSSLESKLDKIFAQVDNISRSVQYAQKDVGLAREEVRLFKNHSHEQLDSLAGSVTIIQSLLVEGHRQQKQQLHQQQQHQQLQSMSYPVKGESMMDRAAEAGEPPIYVSCDVESKNTSQIEKLLPEPGFGEAFPVFCDQDYEAGGWIVVQNRVNGSVDFYRGWKEYKNGFGNLNGEFWLGLDKLHALTYSAPYELHVLMEDFDNKTVVAKYSRFAVGNEQESYAITKLGDYSGTAGDGLGYHRGGKFSTMDVNHDVPGNNGGIDWTGAWWYRRGHHSNLNGQYLSGPVDHSKHHGKGMTWNPFRGDDYSLKRSRMMIKRTTMR